MQITVNIPDVNSKDAPASSNPNKILEAIDQHFARIEKELRSSKGSGNNNHMMEMQMCLEKYAKQTESLLAAFEKSMGSMMPGHENTDSLLAALQAIQKSISKQTSALGSIPSSLSDKFDRLELAISKVRPKTYPVVYGGGAP